MPYNEQLADRVRELIAPVTKKVDEKRMFSGLCFMVNGKMCVAVSKDRIMIRFDPEKTDAILEMDGVRPMVMSGKHLQGYAYVDEGVLGTRKQLSYWVGLALEFNAFAKASKGAAKKKPAPKKKSARRG